MYFEEPEYEGVTQTCLDAQLDVYACLAELSCDDFETENIASCDDAQNAVAQECGF